MKKNYLYIAVIGITLCLGSSSTFAQKAGYAQQFAILKRMKPELTTIGVMGSMLNDKSIDALTHAAAGQGLKIVVGVPKSIHDVAEIYRKLVDKGAQVIFVPDGSDNLVLGNGFEFLRESSLTDRIGIMVPQQSLVSGGALCSVTMEDGKYKAFVNQRIAQVVGANIPGGDEKVTYVTQ
ncbi:MAG TPA: hypothetical protein VMU30_02595 [Bacteroidota bacterium]|nr:hypothetical protein [Bacteroidota bacterium]